ncbi:MAG: inositol monophosphatase family protein [Patescibacteria group bacterium]
MDIKKLHNFITNTVLEAGDLLIKKRAEGFTHDIKNNDPKNVVTSLDYEINDFLTKKIEGLFPEHTIVSEEADTIQHGSEYTWVIDPIDGTNNFMRGIPHFAVVLGVLKGEETITSAVYNPATKELFHFTKGSGAFLHDKPIKVSNTKELTDAHVFLHTGRKKELRDWGGKSYTKLLNKVHKTSNLASSALDTCFVAAGRVDASVYGTMMTLDSAPALGILIEAGGVYSDAAGNKPTLSNVIQKLYLANNQTMLEEIRQILET